MEVITTKVIIAEELKKLISGKKPILVSNPDSRAERWLNYDAKMGTFLIESPYINECHPISESKAIKLYSNRPIIVVPVSTAKKQSSVDIILPIHQKWIDLIMSGKKTIEVRKVIPRQLVKTIYIYNTSPVSKIIGSIEIEKIEVFNGIKQISEIKKQLKKACLTEDDFLKYIGNDMKKGVVFYYIKNPVIFTEPIKISVIPQSMVYCNERLNMEIQHGQLSS
jgi:predicted transcriptional regulator